MATTNTYLQDRTGRSFLEPSFSLKEAIGINIALPPLAGAVAWTVHRLYYQSQQPAEYAILWTCRLFTFLPIKSMGDFIFGIDLPPVASSDKKGEEIKQPINYTRDIGKIALFALAFIPSVYLSHSLAIRLGCTVLEPWGLALTNTYLPFFGFSIANDFIALGNKIFES